MTPWLLLICECIFDKKIAYTFCFQPVDTLHITFILISIYCIFQVIANINFSPVDIESIYEKPWCTTAVRENVSLIMY